MLPPPKARMESDSSWLMFPFPVDEGGACCCISGLGKGTVEGAGADGVSSEGFLGALPRPPKVGSGWIPVCAKAIALLSIDHVP